MMKFGFLSDGQPRDKNTTDGQQKSSSNDLTVSAIIDAYAITYSIWLCRRCLYIFHFLSFRLFEEYRMGKSGAGQQLSGQILHTLGFLSEFHPAIMKPNAEKLVSIYLF